MFLSCFNDEPHYLVLMVIASLASLFSSLKGARPDIPKQPPAKTKKEIVRTQISLFISSFFSRTMKSFAAVTFQLTMELTLPSC